MPVVVTDSQEHLSLDVLVDMLARLDLDQEQLVGLPLAVDARHELEPGRDGRDGEVPGRLPPLVLALLGAGDPLDPAVVDADRDETTLSVRERHHDVRERAGLHASTGPVEPLVLAALDREVHAGVVRQEP